MAKNKAMPLPPRVPGEDVEHFQEPQADLDGTVELDVASEPPPVAAPPPKHSGSPHRKIKVTANRAGFIHQERKVAGSKFEVTEKELGHWMDCDDPLEQKKHHARQEEIRKKHNQKSAEEDAKDRAAVD